MGAWTWRIMTWQTGQLEREVHEMSWRYEVSNDITMAVLSCSHETEFDERARSKPDHSIINWHQKLAFSTQYKVAFKYSMPGIISQSIN